MKKLKTNNSGSTLILALIAMAFVVILGSVIISTALTSYKMKIVDNKSKKTFYSAEKAIDEIYVGLGVKSMSSISQSYESIVTSLITNDASGNQLVVDDAMANENLKIAFIKDMVSSLTNDTFSFGASDTLISTLDATILEEVRLELSKYISEPTLSKINSLSQMQADLSLKKIILYDVSVSYKNADGFFADVTIDVEITYPNMSISFTTRGANQLKAFLPYGLISDSGIYFGDMTSSHEGNYNIFANAYSGDNGINVIAGSEVNFSKNPLEDYEKPIIVTKGDLNVVGAPNKESLLDISSTEIWCNNITISKDTNSSGAVNRDIGASIIIDGNSKSYVYDDIALNGIHSSARISGSYYGYNLLGDYMGTGHVASSSAIINGRYSKLWFDNLNELILAGRAYINFGNDSIEPYITGESTSVKGNQEVYLVLDRFIKSLGTEESPNPMTRGQWNSLGSIPVDLTDFYAKDLLTKAGYVTKEVDGEVYIYLEFSSKDNANKYIKTLISDSYCTSLYGRSNFADRILLKNILTTNLSKMLKSSTGSGSIAVDMNTDGTLYSTGTMFEVDTNSNSSLINIDENARGSSSLDELRLISLDLGIKYDLLKHRLLKVEQAQKLSSVPSSVVIDGINVDIPYDYQDETVVNSIVDVRKILNLATPFTPEVSADAFAIVHNGDYTVPLTATKGLILVAGDVLLDHSFSGLIIATGNIVITGDGSIDNDYDIDNLLLSNRALGNFFYAYRVISPVNDGTEISDVSYLKYSDLISLNNWRKNSAD